jgi:hypothetical protein
MSSQPDPFTDCTLVVSGGSRGIGLAIAAVEHFGGSL